LLVDLENHGGDQMHELAAESDFRCGRRVRRANMSSRPMNTEAAFNPGPHAVTLEKSASRNSSATV
jgi:hypothetical protein